MSLTISREEECWLKLSLVKTLDVPVLLAAIRRVGDVGDFFELSFANLVDVVGLEAARELQVIKTSSEVERWREWLIGNEHVGFLTLTHSLYPQLMIEAGIAPLVLWYRGEIEQLKKPILTVSGCSHPDADSLYNADIFGDVLGSQSRVLLSTGLNSEIEVTFVKSVLRRSEASILAWMPCGLDRVWPSFAKPLVDKILDNKGVILSACPPGERTTSEEREKANVLRVASTKALFVICANRTSSVIKMAQLAANLGRNVMALPGSIHSPLHKGCHLLIKQGAKLVETADEILTEFSSSTC